MKNKIFTILICILSIWVISIISVSAGEKIKLGTTECESGLLAAYGHVGTIEEYLEILVITEKGLTNLRCIPKVRINNLYDNSDSLITGKIIKYMLDSNGYITDIKTYNDPIKSETEAAYDKSLNKIGNLTPFNDSTILIFGYADGYEYYALDRNLTEGLEYEIDVYEEKDGYTSLAHVKAVACQPDKVIIKSVSALLNKNFDGVMSLDIKGSCYNSSTARRNLTISIEFKGEIVFMNIIKLNEDGSFSASLANMTEDALNYLIRIQTVDMEYATTVVQGNSEIQSGLLVAYEKSGTIEQYYDIKVITDKGTLTLRCASKVKINDSYNNFNDLAAGIIRYALNNDGEINRIKTYAEPIKTVTGAAYDENLNQICGIEPFNSSSNIIFGYVNGWDYSELSQNLISGLQYDVDVYEETDGYTALANVKAVTCPPSEVIIEKTNAVLNKEFDGSMYIEIEGYCYNNTIPEDSSVIIEFDENMIIEAAYLDSQEFYVSIPNATEDALNYTIKIYIENKGIRISNEYVTMVKQGGKTIDSGLLAASDVSGGIESNLELLVATNRGDLVFKCMPIIKFNGYHIRSKYVFDRIIPGKPIEFILNSEGIITDIKTYDNPIRTSEFALTYSDTLNKIGDLAPFNSSSILVFGKVEGYNYTEITPDLIDGYRYYIDVYEEENGYTTVAHIWGVICSPDKTVIKKADAVLNKEFDGTMSLVLDGSCYLDIPTASRAVIELYKDNTIIRTIYVNEIYGKCFYKVINNMPAEALNYAIRLWIEDGNYNVISNIKIIGELYSQFEIEPLIKSAVYNTISKELELEVSFGNMGFTAPKIIAFVGFYKENMLLALEKAELNLGMEEKKTIKFNKTISDNINEFEVKVFAWKNKPYNEPISSVKTKVINK